MLNSTSSFAGAKQMIAIVDYGAGNLGSIRNMLHKLDAGEVILATSSEEIKNADKYILPGVGAFDTGMRMLNESGMRDELDKQVKECKKPILGICLGMQMLGTGSEEGSSEGLGYIDMSCRRFCFDNLNLRIPHMGWDYVETVKDTLLTTNPKDNVRFYFVHSYFAVCENKDDVMFECDYGIRFAAGVNHDNIYGVQFHPEKSHNYGKWLMGNFVRGI